MKAGLLLKSAIAIFIFHFIVAAGPATAGNRINSDYTGGPVDFGQTQTGGSDSALVSIWFDNDAHVDSQVEKIGLESGDLNEFTLENVSCPNLAPPSFTMLAAPRLCAFNVHFNPGADGDKNAILLITSTVFGVANTITGSPMRIQIKGSGVTTMYQLQVDFPGSGSGWVTATGGSLDCGGNCSGQYQKGTTVTLEAIADSGSEFSGWGGACAGTWRGAPCLVTVNSDTGVTATFETTQPGNGGTADGSNGSGCVPELISPPDGQVLPGTSADFEWTLCQPRVLAESDGYGYELYYCENENFEGCGPVNVASKASDGKQVYLSGVIASGAGLLVFGFIGAGGARTRKGKVMLLAFVFVAVSLVAACSGSSSSDSGGSTTTSTSSTYSVSGLTPLATYWWKIVTIAPDGTRSESGVRSFTTGP